MLKPVDREQFIDHFFRAPWTAAQGLAKVSAVFLKVQRERVAQRFADRSAEATVIAEAQRMLESAPGSGGFTRVSWDSFIGMTTATPADLFGWFRSHTRHLGETGKTLALLCVELDAASQAKPGVMSDIEWQANKAFERDKDDSLFYLDLARNEVRIMDSLVP
jgi:hypothetical protein